MRSDDQDSQREHQLAAEAVAQEAGVTPGGGIAEAPVEEPRFLFFHCAGVDCAAPLTALREVLPRCPAALPLPHTPDWLLGVFALRAELVGLADPAALLFDHATDRGHAPSTYGAALLVGSGARALAWAVESIGATTALGGPTAGDEETAGAQAPRSDAAEDPHAVHPSVAAPYATGAVALADGRRYTVIDAEALLADMLRALEERPATP